MKRKARLLVIDDELDIVPPEGGDTRRKLYERLSSEFELAFVESPSQLHPELEKGNFDALLIDFILEEWGLDARDVIRSVRDGMPVMLISKAWSANFGKLSEAIASFPIARLFTWDEMTTPSAREILAFWINTAISARYGSLAVGYQPDDSFRIVQFSDMQFNAANGKMFETDTQVAIQAIQAKWADPPHFLALPGDIAEAGLPTEYEMATQWIERVRSGLGQECYRVEVLTAPGNHDVCWPLALAQRFDKETKNLSDNKVCYPELARYGLTAYREFSLGLDPPLSWDKNKHYWVSGNYRQAGLILFGLNTSEDLDEWGLPTRRLNDSTMARLFADIAKLKRDAPKALVVGLMHHPLELSDESILNASEFKRNINETTGSIILLTGHVHEEATNLIAVGRSPATLQIGSATYTLDSKKRPEDSLRGFNLIELKRKNDIVTQIDVQTYAIMGHQLHKFDLVSYKNEEGRIALV